jgi:RNA polymerase sigma-70 factor (ECF subfamily)
MRIRVGEHNRNKEFEAAMLPHLDAAYRLARWLTGDDHGAEDVVQMAYLRAFRFFDDFRGDDARAWLLKIVRNTCFSSLRDARHQRDALPFDEQLHSDEQDGVDVSVFGMGNNPEAILARRDTGRAVNQALAGLPLAFREVLVLKEMDGLSYKQIAEIADIPIGTVMSRLARGRKLLADYFRQHGQGERDGL